MILRDTVELMLSDNYRDRFKAEYYQTKIRRDKLNAMIEKMDAGTLEFEPTCDRLVYRVQISAMNEYLAVLEERAKEENIDL